MKFLVLEGQLLGNPNLRPTDKFILQFLRNLSKSGKSYWGEAPYLAREFGVGIDYIEKRFTWLTETGLIKKVDSGWTLNQAWWEIMGFGNHKGD
jgi:hypothetical protein